MKRVLHLVVAGMLVGCDPGYTFSPEGWTKGEHYSFNHTEQNFRLSIATVGGVVGQSYVTVEGRIENLTQAEITFEEPELSSGGVTYKGRYFGPGRPALYTLSSATDQRFAVSFDFTEPLHEALTEQAIFRVGYRVGEGARQELRITFNRDAS